MTVMDRGCEVNIGFYRIALSYHYVMKVAAGFTYRVCGQSITLSNLLKELPWK